jgi:hypothetical protein
MFFMAVQTVFKRYELKFLLTAQQKARLLPEIEQHMQIDQYGRSLIKNLYFDTDSYRLIRRSLEKPDYKEKLRIRSYGSATPESTVFVELKKKYDGVVYKRRIPMTEQAAMAWLCGQGDAPPSQIAEEIRYFAGYYETLHPTVFLSYEREAYYCNDGSAFRLTFDSNILCRQENLSLCAENYGTPLLPEDHTLMELKCPGGIPLWLTRLLSREKLYKTSFSKYGTAYQMMIFSKEKENIAHA